MKELHDSPPPAEGPEESQVAVIPDSRDLERSGWLWRIVDWLLFTGITGMLVILLVQIVGRLIGASPSWTEESARFLFMGGVFLGLASGFRIGAHPRVAFLVIRGPRWVRTGSLYLTLACAVVLFGVLAWKAFELVQQQLRTGESSPSLAIGMFAVTLPLAVGAVLAIIGTAQAILFDPSLRQRLADGEVIA